jgi:enoyl-CoA hydratase/carnithine racemase
MLRNPFRSCIRARLFSSQAFFSGEQIDVHINHLTRVATITLNSPKTFNSLNEDMGREMRAAVGQLNYNTNQFDSVILTGTAL